MYSATTGQINNWETRVINVSALLNNMSLKNVDYEVLHCYVSDGSNYAKGALYLQKVSSNIVITLASKSGGGWAVDGFLVYGA